MRPTERAGLYATLAGMAGAMLGAARSRGRARASRAQLETVLDNLAQAVTVQDASGRLIYANQAAAEAMGYATPEELIRTSVTAILSRFRTVHEDGRPLEVDDLPGRRVLAGEEPEPLLVRVHDLATGEERWRLVKATAVRDGDGPVRYAINVVEDVTDVKRAELAQRTLAEFSRVLSASLDTRATLAGIADVAVPWLADWCVVHVPDEEGLLELVGIAHADPERVQDTRLTCQRYPVHLHEDCDLANVAREGRSVLRREIPREALAAAARDQAHLEALEATGMRSAMIVPLCSGGRPAGALTLVNTTSGRAFTEADLEVATELGRRAGAALANARLFEERSEIARALQQDLLPPELPEIDGFKTAAMYRAAGEVGGDFYDAFPISDGWLLAVGDVVGRGPAAAGLTALARYTLRTAAALTGDPGAAMAILNGALRDHPRMSLCSVCLVALHGDEVTIVSAGHPSPIVLRAGDPSRIGVAGPLLGVVPDGRWPTTTAPLRAGDQLVLYTDGVLDAEGPEGRFGDERLTAALAGAASADEAVGRLRAALDAFATGDRRDDTAVLALQRAVRDERLRERLLRGPEAPGAARRAVERWLRGALGPDDLENAKLLVSELVTNGVRHAERGNGDAIEVEVAVADRHVRVEVRDPGRGFRPPPLRSPPEDATGGRGLLIVDRVAARWGVAGDQRTCVWFELDR